jgi:hypothetical protein
MLDREAMSPAVRILVALACALAAGCACVRNAPTAPVPEAAAVASTPVAETPEADATPALPPRAIESTRPVQPAPATRTTAREAPLAVAPAQPVVPTRPPPKPAAAVAAPPVPAAPAVVPKAAPVPAPATPQPAAAPLDLKSLEVRLRQTKAIGVLTKLSLKNQVDDLLVKFRAYHKRQGTATLAELRRNYDLLLLKVLSLLQDGDPPLARDIVKSRAAIWSILADPRKFTESNLMAGATP